MSEIWRWSDCVDQMPDLFIASREFPTCDLKREPLPCHSVTVVALRIVLSVELHSIHAIDAVECFVEHVRNRCLEPAWPFHPASRIVRGHGSLTPIRSSVSFR